LLTIELDRSCGLHLRPHEPRFSIVTGLKLEPQLGLLLTPASSYERKRLDITFIPTDPIRFRPLPLTTRRSAQGPEAEEG